MVSIKFLKDRMRFLEERVKEARSTLENLPDGNLSICERRGYPHYYACGLKDKNGRTVKKYIPKHNEDYAADLAQKAYLKEQLKCDLLQIKALERFIRDYEKGSITKVRFKNSDHFFRLLRKRISASFEECQQKLNEMFRSSTKRPEGKRFQTLSGIMVRSKSEVEIANLLYTLEIPFVYEPIIIINGIRISPDFIFMIPGTGAFYMWEHFGKMDESDYAMKSLHKLETLYMDGWILGQNLIVTTETYDSPFNAEKAAYALRQVVPV